MTRHVLIVEDDPAHAEALRRGLSESRHAWHVQVVDSLQACRDALSKSAPDIALVDLNLPDGRADSLLSWPPEDGAFPVVVMTSHGDETVAVAAMKAGALDYVVKSPEAFAAIPHTAERALREWDARMGHRRAEEELRRSRERLLIAKEAAGLGMYDLDLQAHYIEADDRFRELWGFEPDRTIRYEDVISRIYPDDRSVHASAVESALRPTGGGRYATEYRVTPRPGGAVTWVAMTGRTVFENGQPVRLVGTVQSVTERKRVEEAIRDGEAKLKAVVTGAIDAIVTIDAGGTVLSFNPAAERTFGYAAGEVLGRNVSVLMPSALHEGHDGYLARYLRTGERHVIGAGREIPARRKDGTVFPMEIGVSEIRVGGNIIFVGILRDITERRAAEEEIRALNANLEATVARRTAELESMLANATIGLAFADRDLRCVRVNPFLSEINGLPVANHIGRTIREINPRVAPLIEPHILEVFRTGRPVQGVELRLATPDGAAVGRVCVLSFYPVISPEGAVMLVGTTLTDVTERRRVEEELAGVSVALNAEIAGREEAEQQMRRLSAVIEACPDYIGMTDSDRQVTYLNRAFREALGRSPDRDVLRIEDCLPESAVRVIEAEGIPTALRTGAWMGETALVTQEGSSVPVSQLIISQRDPQGDHPFFATIMRDISERKRMEESLRSRSKELLAANAELAQASRLKDEFLASMSHELRTPLNAVLGFSQSLVEGTYGAVSSEQARVIGDIERSGRHLLGLINDILDLSRIGAGHFKLNPSRMSVAAVCQAGLRMVRQTAQAKRLKLTMTTDEMIGPVVADELRLKQILVNLLSNAVKFTPEGGEVTLEVRGDPAARTLTFAVRDTGIGIRQEEMGILFQPFRQIDSRLSRQYAGTGLGLALVRRLAELHGGTAAAESAPGKGSRFSVSIPWVPVTEVEVPATASVKCSPAGEIPPSYSDAPAADRATADAAARMAPLLLLAEDDELSGSMIADVLTTTGYRVARARDGSEAVRLARELAPRLVLMDIQMPGTDGLEAIRLLRTRTETRGIPVVAVTALAMVGDRERCLEAGASAYISKPFKLDELRQVVRELLEPSRPSSGACDST